MNVRLILCVENTSRHCETWQDVRNGVVEPILRALDKSRGQVASEFALVLFGAKGFSCSEVESSGWTEDVQELRQWLDAIDFAGGGGRPDCGRLTGISTAATAAELCHAVRRRGLRLSFATRYEPPLGPTAVNYHILHSVSRDVGAMPSAKNKQHEMGILLRFSVVTPRGAIGFFPFWESAARVLWHEHGKASQLAARVAAKGASKGAETAASAASAGGAAAAAKEASSAAAGADGSAAGEVGGEAAAVAAAAAAAAQPSAPPGLAPGQAPPSAGPGQQPPALKQAVVPPHPAQRRPEIQTFPAAGLAPAPSPGATPFPVPSPNALAYPGTASQPNAISPNPWAYPAAPSPNVYAGAGGPSPNIYAGAGGPSPNVYAGAGGPSPNVYAGAGGPSPNIYAGAGGPSPNVYAGAGGPSPNVYAYPGVGAGQGMGGPRGGPGPNPPAYPGGTTPPNGVGGAGMGGGSVARPTSSAGGPSPAGTPLNVPTGSPLPASFWDIMSAEVASGPLDGAAGPADAPYPAGPPAPQQAPHQPPQASAHPAFGFDAQAQARAARAQAPYAAAQPRPHAQPQLHAQHQAPPTHPPRQATQQQQQQQQTQAQVHPPRRPAEASGPEPGGSAPSAAGSVAYPALVTASPTDVLAWRGSVLVTAKALGHTEVALSASLELWCDPSALPAVRLLPPTGLRIDRLLADEARLRRALARPDVARARCVPSGGAWTPEGQRLLRKARTTGTVMVAELDRKRWAFLICERGSEQGPVPVSLGIVHSG